MWYDITPTNSKATQNLRTLLRNYGNNRIRVLPNGEPDYETEYDSYRVSHEWFFSIISEEELQEDHWDMARTFILTRRARLLCGSLWIMVSAR